MIMDCVLEIVRLLREPVAGQIDYIKGLEERVQDLRNKRETLVCRESDVRKEVERADREQMDHRSEVDDWLEKVKEIKEEVIIIEKEYEDSIKGWFPRYCVKRNVGKRASEALKNISEADRLYESGRLHEGVAVRPLPKTAQTLPTKSLIGRSAEKAKNQILDWIQDNKVGIIGVHGMGGAGKTTIMENVNNHLEDAKLFNYIFFVTVSQDTNLKTLQTKISKKINFTLPEDDEIKERAALLHEELIKRQKFLIILDDMWEPFTLEQVGIPNPNEENGCKVVLTTRELIVCQRVRTQETLRVGILPEDEAWALFEDRVGRDTLLDSDVRNLARDVANECKGLPLALNTVGAALRDAKDAHEWKHALKQLRGSNCQIAGMQNEVFERLKFSYDRLSNDKVRACFLYCSLYPEDYSIDVDEVIRYWVWEGLIDEDGNMEDQINEGHTIVEGLKRASMLQTASKARAVKRVKMHDLLRDMAIGITKNNPRFINKAGNGLEEPLKNEAWVGDIRRVSLMQNKMNSLSGIPNWPKLTTLFLQHNRLLRDISPSFFQHTGVLTVLNLSYTRIKRLPDSLSKLVNLRALLLSGCGFLSDMPSLSNLKELRELNLSGTAIRQLPSGMGGFANLRFLILSSRKENPLKPRALSKCTDLETTSIMIDASCIIRECSLLDEIATLRRLADLKLNIAKLPIFTHYVKSGHAENLGNFSFFVGKMPLLAVEVAVHWKTKRSVCANGSQDSAEENSFLLPGNTVGLHLAGWRQLSLFSLLFRSNVRGLKSCGIADCNTMEYIWSEGSDASFLGALEHLYLSMLASLQVVFQGVAWHGTFQSLKTIQICRCSKLKYLFGAGMLKSLQNLQAIRVLGCHGMVEVVSDDDGGITEVPSSGDENTIILPKLNSIELISAYKLQRICSKMLLCTSMDSIIITGCPNLKKIPLSINTLTVGFEGKITGERAWWEALEWDDPATKELLLAVFKEKNVPT